jgi:hypothetical protein
MSAQINKHVISFDIDETLANFIKQTANKRGKKEQRERTQAQARSTKTQIGSQKGKRTNYVLESPPIASIILEKEKERKLERIISLKNGPHMK